MNDVDELICKAEADTQVENKCMDNQGGKRRGMEWEIGIDIFTLCVCVCLCACVCTRVCVCTQLCPTLQPLDCSPPGSSVYGIFQIILQLSR